MTARTVSLKPTGPSWQGVPLLHEELPPSAPAYPPPTEIICGTVIFEAFDRFLLLFRDEGGIGAFEVGVEVPVTVNGKPAKLKDVKPGNRTQVTVGASAPHVALKVEAMT